VGGGGAGKKEKREKGKERIHKMEADLSDLEI
jgi:hypothetical protein